MTYPDSWEEIGEMVHALDEKRRAWEEQPPPEHFRNVAWTDADRDLLNDLAEEKDWERSADDEARFMGWK